MFQIDKALGRTVKVNGTEIYYEARGQGPAVLFISGATGDAGHFQQVADLLAGEFTVVTYDRRGNSRSPSPASRGKTSADEQADDAAGLIRALGRAPVRVYGNSSGAIIALNLVIRYPELLSGALLHEPPLLSVLPHPEEVMGPLEEMIEGSMAAGGPRKAMEAFARFAAGDATFEQLDSSLRERMLSNGETFLGVELGTLEAYRPDDPTLASVRLPVQVLASEESAPFFGEIARWLAERLNVEIVRLPGGHAPQFDHPREMVDVIRPFLMNGRTA